MSLTVPLASPVAPPAGQSLHFSCEISQSLLSNNASEYMQDLSERLRLFGDLMTFYLPPPSGEGFSVNIPQLCFVCSAIKQMLAC